MKKPKTRKSKSKRVAAPRPPSAGPHSKNTSFPIVGIGASAGGLEAFTRLLEHLPPDTGMAFVLVQHLDPDHASALTSLLARTTAMPVREVTNQLPVQPNHVYVIPPNAGMALAQGCLKLVPPQQTRGARSVIDSFFESLAREQHGQAIGVVLSGTASDGARGLEAIKAEGGITLAQDDSAKYTSMPRSAIAAGVVDFVLPPEQIAAELARLARHPWLQQPPKPLSPPGHQPATPPAPAAHGQPLALPSGAAAPAPAGDPAAFRTILELLHNHSGVDFSLYKPATLQRRISRRLVLNKSDTLEAYAAFLHANPPELETLYSDLLIHVTSFFRDPKAFDALKRKVFPRLLQARRNPAEPVRFWVLGCSTGQEAYSLAIACLECCEQLARPPRLQVFATDLNEALLEKARHGLYPKSLLQEVSPERLQRFFVEEPGGFRVSKSLRQLCVFARQNVLTDPPFSRMDLVSCRNLLIYLEPALQQKLLQALHYALKPEGFLFLGASESVGPLAGLFAPVDKSHKIFSRKAGPAAGAHRPVVRNLPAATKATPPAPPSPVAVPASELSPQREADRLTLARFAPPGVLVNAQLQILQFRGPTGAFLQAPTGSPTADLLKLARPGLLLPLADAFKKAKKQNQAVRAENVRVEHNGPALRVNLEILPLKNLKERCYLVLFEEAAPEASRPAPTTASARSQPPRSETARALERRAAELQRELEENRDYLQALQEQYEAANEELQAANEEATSANEELQSINEELETSKEELESANEELLTVNEEMAGRNAELNRLNGELTDKEHALRQAHTFSQAVIDSVPPLLILSPDLKVQDANQSFYEAFQVAPAKTLHRLIYDLGNGQWNIPALRRLLEELLPRKQVLHDYEVTHEFEQLGRRTMLLNARQIDHVQTIILSFADITEVKEAEKLARQARETLAQHAAGLEQAVAQRTTTLRETVRELEAFSYSMVHDMRAPLRAMNSFAHMLQQHYGALLDDSGRDMLQRILSSAHRMDQLIQDVLNYTHVLRDNAPLGPVNAEELMRDLLATYPDWTHQAELQVAGPLPVVIGHKALLAQCLSHLVGNAIKFVAPGVQPRVRIWAESVKGGEPVAESPAPSGSQPSTIHHQLVRICIQDNGVGIQPEHRERVFGMFQRIYPASEYEGTGIGLTIVRRAAERMGGRVGFDSQPGKGSTFWLQLPAAEQKPSRA